MSLTWEVLGGPGQDNALWVRLDSGQGIRRLLFDCGEGCLATIPFVELQQLDHLCFSHLHMDHVAGFDSLFRGLFNRQERPNQVWGPVGTAEILQHRFRGFLWNLHGTMSATWRVHDLACGVRSSARFELAEAFAQKHADQRHDAGTTATDPVVIDLETATVEAHPMNHGTPSLAWIVREKTKVNVDVSRLAGLGLRPGPWLKQLTTATGPELGQTVTVGDTTRTLAELRKLLLKETPGESVAYLTDFLLDDEARRKLVPLLQDCTTLICEAQYRASDLDLAQRNFHMTTRLTAELAREAGVQQLVLFHLSSRYTAAEWCEMLAEARAIFPSTRFPPHWPLT